MELTVSVNGNNCEVKFEPAYHTFQKVIKLLKNNNLIPIDMSLEKIEIIGIDGRCFKKQNYVRDCLPNPQAKKCNVKMKFPQIVPQSLMTSSNLDQSNSMIKKAKLAEIVRSFFQKMENRQFRKLDKYQNHQEEVISALAKFGKHHQKLYAHFLFYKENLGKLNPQQKQELLEYKQKFKELYNSLGKVMKENVYLQSNSEKQVQNLKGKENQRKINELQMRIQMQCQQIDNQKIQYHELSLRFEQIKQRCRRLEEQLQDRGSRLADIKNTLSTKQKMIKELTDSNEKLRSSFNQKKLNYQKLSNVLEESKIRDMESSIQKEEFQKQREKFQRQINNLKEKNNTLEKQKNNNKKQRQQLCEEKKQLQQKMSNLEKQKSKMKEELKNLQKQHNSFKKSSEDQTRKYSQQKQKFIKSITILEERLAKITQQINNIKDLNQKLMNSISESKLQKNKLLQQNQYLKEEVNELKSKNNELLKKKKKSGNSIILLMKQSQSKIAFAEQIQSSFNLLSSIGFSNQEISSFQSKFLLYVQKSFESATLFLHHTQNLKLSYRKITQSLKRRPNILFICKTIQNKIIGAFTTLPIERNSINIYKNLLSCSKTFLFNIEENTVNLFDLKTERQPIQFDEQFLIFGQEQLSLQYQTFVLQSRFVTNPINGLTSFSSNGYNRSRFLKSDEPASTVKITEYWMFQCVLK